MERKPRIAYWKCKNAFSQPNGKVKGMEKLEYLQTFIQDVTIILSQEINILLKYSSNGYEDLCYSVYRTIIYNILI
jgi:hypothetical protein